MDARTQYNLDTWLGASLGDLSATPSCVVNGSMDRSKMEYAMEYVHFVANELELTFYEALSLVPQARADIIATLTADNDADDEEH